MLQVRSDWAFLPERQGFTPGVGQYQRAVRKRPVLQLPGVMELAGDTFLRNRQHTDFPPRPESHSGAIETPGEILTAAAGVPQIS